MEYTSHIIKTQCGNTEDGGWGGLSTPEIIKSLKHKISLWSVRGINKSIVTINSTRQKETLAFKRGSKGLYSQPKQWGTQPDTSIKTCKWLCRSC